MKTAIFPVSLAIIMAFVRFNWLNDSPGGIMLAHGILIGVSVYWSFYWCYKTQTLKGSTVFKNGLKHGMYYIITMSLAVYSFYKWIRPSTFLVKKNALISAQAKALEEAGSPEKIEEVTASMEQLFTVGNYSWFTFVGQLLLTFVIAGLFALLSSLISYKKTVE